MKRSKTSSLNAKTILMIAAVCAFCSVFSTFDTSEQYRAWKTARTWTEEQKAVAPALDADSMAQNALAGLLLNTGVIVVSFVGLFVLVMAIATDNEKLEVAALGLVVIALVFGVFYSVCTLIYQTRVGPRLILKGPIFDYDLHMQVPVIVAVAGYPLLSVALIVAQKRRRQ